MRLLALAFAIPAVAYAGSDSEAHLAAEVGGGGTTLLGQHYGSIDVGFDLSAHHWLTEQLGIGVRLGYMAMFPLDGPHEDGHPISREMPWLVQPELVVRTQPVAIGAAKLDWVAGLAVGAAWLRTIETCGKRCEKVLERETAIAATLFAGGAVDVHHVALFAGLRGGADAAGDRDVGLVLDAGATF